MTACRFQNNINRWIIPNAQKLPLGLRFKLYEFTPPLILKQSLFVFVFFTGKSKYPEAPNKKQKGKLKCLDEI
jgi:hypothetical protein